ncbi:hypothetical protein BGZ70_002695 [Mortierella alpina]|uniref:Major facilitator superfamily (MFS) profile domain-containing protein n=1 Tax=Mortierella alpina TaxID=64518 RepID=A0A9P6LWL1_MORAP|nr:hypothetical protein BGZ70_002695 [Mortierella alpina]
MQHHDGRSQETLSYDTPQPVIVQQSATLITPVTIQDHDATGNTDESSDPKQHQDHDGHEDIDNEQPYGWVVVAAAFFVQAIVIGTINGYGDRYITHEYSTSSTFELAWVGTLNVVGMDLTGPITGQIADHFGYRLSAFAGALIMGASLVATSFSTKVWQLYLFQGIMYASVLFKARVETGRSRSKRLKREQSDREHTMTEEEKNDAVTAQEHMKESPSAAAPKKKAVDFSMLKDKHFALLVALSFFVANGYFNPYYFFPTYAQKNGASVSTASLLIGILNGSSAIGRVTMGLASDHIGDINTLLISCLFASLSILVVWMFAGTSIPIMAVFCILYGFFSGSFVAIVPTVAAHLCGISRLASVTGIVYGGIAVGTLIGSPVGGALLDLSKGVDYQPLQLWAGLVMMVGVVLTVVLKFMMNPTLFGRV